MFYALSVTKYVYGCFVLSLFVFLYILADPCIQNRELSWY